MTGSISTPCIICGKGWLGEPNLLDGHAVHQKCRLDLEEEKEALFEKIQQAKALLQSAKNQMNGPSPGIMHFLFQTSSYNSFQVSQDNGRKRVAFLESQIADYESRYEETRNELAKIYDYLPYEYPPDWPSRSMAIKIKRKKRCSVCRKYIRGKAHAHHKKPVSKGGNHTEKNLQVLCVPCHSQKHGGRNVDYPR